jgi:hypothetical protein
MFNGAPLDINSQVAISNAIATGKFDADGPVNLGAMLARAESLSEERANNVKQAVIKYAKDHNMLLNPSLFRTVGLGIQGPIVARPLSDNDKRKNMRAQFNLYLVQAE